MKKIQNLIFSLIISLLFLACENGAEEEPKPNELIKNFSEQFSLNKKWTKKIFKDLPSGKIKLSHDNNSIYVFSSSGEVQSISLEGKINWKKNLSKSFSTGISKGLDTLFLASDNGKVYCLSKENGKLIWETPIGGEILSPPVSNGDIVAIQSVDGRLTALDSETGNFRWDYRSLVSNLSLRGTSEPAFHEGFLFVGFGNGNFAKIQPRSGVVQWEIPVTISEETSEIGRLVDIDGNFSFSSGISFVASYQGNISAIDIRNGRTIWREKTSSSDDVLASRGKVFISDEKDNITAYEQTNGNISWKNSDFFLRELTSPKRLKSLIVLGDFQGFVHLISQKDGSQLGRERVSRKGLINVEVIEDKVLALDRNGKLSLFLLQ